MRLKRPVLVTLFFALGFAFVSVITASACETDADDFPHCASNPVLLPAATAAATAKPMPRPAAAVPTPVAYSPGGTSPDDALTPQDQWLSINAGAALWFRIGEGINAQHLDVWLDANGISGVGFGVYSPEQMNDPASRTYPKGRGTPNRTIPHDLFWSGQAPRGGVWYVLVTNSSATPVQFKLGYNRAETAGRDCSGPYWEYIKGNLVLWPGLCK